MLAQRELAREVATRVRQIGVVAALAEVEGARVREVLREIELAVQVERADRHVGEHHAAAGSASTDVVTLV